jgi:hypothetical protein
MRQTTSQSKPSHNFQPTEPETVLFLTKFILHVTQQHQPQPVFIKNVISLTTLSMSLSACQFTDCLITLVWHEHFT